MKILKTLILLIIWIPASPGVTGQEANSANHPVSQEVNQKPVIFNHTETVNPGETIGLQGAYFGGDPQVWFARATGNEKELKPQLQIKILTYSEMYVAATIPENTQPGLYAIWVNNGSQLSAPVFINRSRVITSEFDEIMPGTKFRLFGRNMLMNGKDALVRFVAEDGSEFTAKSTKGDSYVLEVVAPGELKSGLKYKLYTTNGLGGKHGEDLFNETVSVRAQANDPLNLGVPWGADFTFAQNIYNVKTDKRLTNLAIGDGKANDRAAIQEAIDKAAVNGGGVVFLPAGTYKIAYSSGCGISLKSRVVLKGDGKDKTVIHYGYGEPFTTERVKAAYGWTLGWPDSRIEGMGLVFPGFMTTGGLIGLSVINVNESGLFVHTIKNQPEGGSKLVLKDCSFDFSTGWGLAMVNVDKLLVSGCSIKSRTLSVRGINAPTRTWPWDFKNSYNVIIRDNFIDYYAGRFGANGCHHALFENNTFLRNGDHQAKGETGGLNFDYVTDMVILGNSFLVSGQPILSRNQGETILSQGGDPHQMYVGTVAEATATSLTDRKVEWQDFTDRVSTAWQYAVHPTNYSVAVVSGEGTGQWRTIVSNNDTVLKVNRPWDVVPKPGSRFVINQWSAWQLLVKDNVLKDNHQGIMMYCGGADIAITGNKLHNSGGIYLRADQRLQLKRYNLLWNTLVEGNEIIDSDGRRAAFVSMMLALQKEEKLTGTGCIGLEVRNNVVQAFMPNMIKSAIRGEGYLILTESLASNPNYDPKIAGVLGAIFEGNRAINSDNAFIVGAGTHQTVISKTKNENVAVMLKDVVNVKTNTGAQQTITDF